MTQILNPTDTPLTKTEAKALGGLTLAFLGDSVYEVLVRDRIVRTGNLPVDKLHKKAVDKVNAKFQSLAFGHIENMLTEDETDIFKRGRNATGNTVPRSASPAEYRRATGFEALFGYLYLIGDTKRMYELFDAAYNCGGDSDKTANRL